MSFLHVLFDTRKCVKCEASCQQAQYIHVNVIDYRDGQDLFLCGQKHYCRLNKINCLVGYVRNKKEILFSVP